MMTWTSLRSKGGRRDWRENSGSESRWVIGDMTYICACKQEEVLYMDNSEEPLIEIHFQY